MEKEGRADCNTTYRKTPGAYTQACHTAFSTVCQQSFSEKGLLQRPDQEAAPTLND